MNAINFIWTKKKVQRYHTTTYDDEYTAMVKENNTCDLT